MQDVESETLKSQVFDLLREGKTPHEIKAMIKVGGPYIMACRKELGMPAFKRGAPLSNGHRQKKVERLLRTGKFPPREIARRLRVSRTFVNLVRRKIGIPAFPAGRPSVDIGAHYMEVARLKKDGMNFADIGRKLGFSRQYASYVWRSRNVKSKMRHRTAA